MTRFDPLNLTPSASLNRVRILDVPGMELPNDIVGRTGYELLSTETLTAELVTYAPSLRLDTTDAATLPTRFGRCFASDDIAVVQAAHAFARRWGRRLAALVLVLKRGDATQRAARPEWDATNWKHWASIEHLWFGGGLLSGPFGRAVVGEAQAVIQQASRHALTLHIAPHPAYLPLIGGARSIPITANEAVVFDFGGTAVKRAVPTLDGVHLLGLRVLPSTPVSLAVYDPQAPDNGDNARAFVATTVIATLRDVGTRTNRVHIVASMSAYIADDRMLPGQGGRYSAMTHGIDDAVSWLAARIAHDTGIDATLHFIHDGTAAARTFAGATHTAVILAGTALGSGFPPPADAYRLIADNLEII